MKKNLLLPFFIILSLVLFLLLIKQKSESPELNNINTQQATQVKTDTSNKTEVKVTNVVDLSNQNLDKLPSSVLSKTNTEELNISNNNISGALPAEIRHLQNLKVLNASNNKMTGVPAEIGQLTKLEVLDLSNNRLTGLPYELGNLKNLKKFIMSGNNYSKQDLEVIKKGLPANTEIIL